MKLVESRQHASEEARVLGQLRQVPHVAQLLEVINCCLPDSTVCSGLVMPYYRLSTADAHGMRCPHTFSNCSFVGGMQASAPRSWTQTSTFHDTHGNYSRHDPSPSTR